MSEDRTIRGETTMTWGDQARLSMRPVVRSMLVVSLAMAVTILLVWAITSSDSAWLLLRHEPFEALGLVARDRTNGSG